MKKKIGIGIATLGIIILCILLDLFVIGEPIDGKQLAYNITQNNSTLELQVSAKEPAVALRGWKFEQEGNNVYISAKSTCIFSVFKRSIPNIHRYRRDRKRLFGRSNDMEQ